jgi:hypothetical protein
MGLYFEEFTLDRPVTTRGRTVSEADIITFAGISGDWNHAYRRGIQQERRLRWAHCARPDEHVHGHRTHGPAKSH